LSRAATINLVPPPSVLLLPALHRKDGTDEERTQDEASHVVAGRGFAEAARVSGVSRQTVYNWRQKNARFAALLNGWQNTTIPCARHRLLALADAAVTAISDAITTGNARVATELLGELSILVATKLGSTSPGEIERQTDLAEREQLAARVRREGMLRQDAVMAKLLAK
jgi:hypothetical protein